MRWIPSKQMIRDSWEKYSLIVIGNIVFFALLYFISYRPNNDENRAAEFLSMAQAQETQNHNEAAKVLYEKVVSDYPDTRSAYTAKERIEFVNRHLTQEVKEKKVVVQPVIDVEKMLSRKPSVYVATFLAKHYGENKELKSKVLKAIKKYLWIATHHEGVSVSSLKAEAEFQKTVFQDTFFTLQPHCVMKSDWVYDDFYIRNDSFFPWHNANLVVTVRQGGREEKKTIRLPRVRAGESVEMVGFRVKNSGGDVSCFGKVTAREGTANFHTKM